MNYMICYILHSKVIKYFLFGMENSVTEYSNNYKPKLLEIGTGNEKA